MTSYPLRVRGLKYIRTDTEVGEENVVPLEGTWIEMYVDVTIIFFNVVVPLEGTWIEIVSVLI